MGQADPILTRLGAGPAVKKLVETALVLSNSSDPQQRNHAYSFMESAIRELENADVEDHNHPDPEKTKQHHLDHDQNEPVSSVQEEEDEDERRDKKMHEEEDDDERRDKKLHEEEDDERDEHKVHEEVLDNHNLGQRLDGSEQSTENREPYPGTGRDSTNGEKPMQDMDNTVNQWSETNGMVVPGLPPVGANGTGAPGLAPDIAQEMGMQMPAPPPMDTNQMMRQMQYTVDKVIRNYDKKVVTPLVRILKAQKETLKEQKNAMRKLSMEIRETKTNNGNLKLDLDHIRNNAQAKFREIEPAFEGFKSMGEQHYSSVAIQPLPNYQRTKVALARSEIEQMDKMLNSNKNPMYT